MATLVESREKSPSPTREAVEQESEQSGEEEDKVETEEDEVKSKQPVDSAKAKREERMRKLRDLHRRRVSNLSNDGQGKLCHVLIRQNQER